MLAIPVSNLYNMHFASLTSNTEAVHNACIDPKSNWDQVAAFKPVIKGAKGPDGKTIVVRVLILTSYSFHEVDCLLLRRLVKLLMLVDKLPITSPKSPFLLLMYNLLLLVAWSLKSQDLPLSKRSKTLSSVLASPPRFSMTVELTVFSFTVL